MVETGEGNYKFKIIDAGLLRKSLSSYLKPTSCSTAYIFCILEIQGVHFVVSLSRATLTGALSHRKPVFAGN
jgi:hypothetical protein